MKALTNRSLLRPYVGRTVAGLMLAMVSLAGHADFYVVPVPIGKVRIDPADVVELAAPPPASVQTFAPNTQRDMQRVLTTGVAETTAFIVPAGRLLVVTSIKVYPEALGTGTIFLELFQRPVNSFFGVRRESWALEQSAPSQIDMSPGLVFGAGVILRLSNLSTSAGNVRVKAFGYLTNAQ